MAKKVELQISPKGPISPIEMLKVFDLRNVRDSLSLYPQATPRHGYDAEEEERDDSPEDDALTLPDVAEEEQEVIITPGASLLPRPALVLSVNSILPLPDVAEEGYAPGASLLPRPALVPPVSILPLPDVAGQEDDAPEDDALLPRPGLVRAVSVVDSVLPLPDVEKEQEVVAPGDAGDEGAPAIPELHFSRLSVLPPISSGAKPEDDDDEAPTLPKPPLVRALSVDYIAPPSSLRAEFGDYNEEVQIVGSSASVESGDESSSS